MQQALSAGGGDFPTIKDIVVEDVGEESLAVVRPVGIVVSQGNDVVVESGLRAGDRLVVVGQQGLTDGDRIRVVAGTAGEPGGAP